jgi:hypothetical protein
MNDLGSAHRESDTMIHTILDLNDISLSKKCFDCRSIIQWREGDYSFLGEKNHLVDKPADWIRQLQSKAHGLSENDNSPAAQSSANNSRLFQMSAQYQAP